MIHKKGLALGLNVILLFFLISTNLFGQVSSDKSLKLLSEMGFSTTVQKPIDVELTDINDMTSKNISQYKGKWIWLVFWATWCGPCQYEMPVLESLHQEFKDKGLQIIGVSVDSKDVQGIKRFVDKKKITFPVLWDKSGQGQRNYQAQAIPSLYVISPDWKLVGIYRGANNWEASSLMDKISRLTEHKKVDAALIDNQPETQEPLALPNDLIPPVLSFEFDDKNLGNGDRRDFKVHVDWSIDPSRYIIKVPKLVLPNSVELLNVSSSSMAYAEKLRTTYIYKLKFKESGEIAIGPIELNYQPREGGSDQYTKSDGPTVVIEQTYLGLKFQYFYYIGGIFLLALLGSGIYFFRKSTTKKALRQNTVATNWRDELDRIKKLQFKGTPIDYSLEVLNLGIKYALEKGEDISKLEALKENLKYGGRELSSEEIHFYIRKIEQENKDIDQELGE